MHPAGINPFEFSTVDRVIFGWGKAAEAGRAVEAFGVDRVLLVTGKNAERCRFLFDDLRGRGIVLTVYQVSGEPAAETVTDGAKRAREADCQLVVAVGGGSVIDAGKAIAALAKNERDVTDYLEVVGLGLPLEGDPLPLIAVPTTAGTGAEVTRNAVLGVPAHRVKVSMRSPRMLPDTAIVDPELTVSMPPSITASTGLDALTHLMEAYLSNKANPMTDTFCRRGMSCLARSLRNAWHDGDDRSARESMALASLYGGFALANAKLGAVHGFAGPLGGLCGAPHGQVCARLLPFVMRANLEAIPDEDPGKMVLSRYAEVAGILTGDDAATPAAGVAWVEQCCLEFDIPALAKLGMKHDDISDIVGQARRSSSMQGNPLVLSEAVLKQILLDAE